MKEQELIDLGFKRNDVTTEESGSNSYYYYFYTITSGFNLISNSNDELRVVAGEYRWIVKIFNTEDDIMFIDKNELSQFINLVNKNKNNTKKIKP